jgi:vacuolar-type H+-ATPase subunit H
LIVTTEQVSTGLDLQARRRFRGVTVRRILDTHDPAAGAIDEAVDSASSMAEDMISDAKDAAEQAAEDASRDAAEDAAEDAAKALKDKSSG